MKAEINIEILLKLFEKQKSGKLVLNSLEIFKMTKENWKQQICLYLIALIVAMYVGMVPLTVQVLASSIQTIIDIILALFGVVFTGYAFFQALINNEFLIRLVKDVNIKKEKCKLQETNEMFVECMILNLLSILISLILKIVVESIPIDYVLFEKIVYNNICAGLLISLYYYFIFTLIWEIKSFIGNILQLFNIYAGTRVLDLYKDNTNNKE